MLLYLSHGDSVDFIRYDDISGSLVASDHVILLISMIIQFAVYTVDSYILFDCKSSDAAHTDEQSRSGNNAKNKCDYRVKSTYPKIWESITAQASLEKS